MPTIEPTIGRIVWYRGKDNATRAAIITKVHGIFCLNLHVFPLCKGDTDCGDLESVTHADPAVEPKCFPSWTWMPYQMGQAAKTAEVEAKAAGGVARSPDNKITQLQIDGILSRAKVQVSRLGDKSCCVHVTLRNGFEMTEVAACVDPKNYSEEIGRGIAMKRIADRLWMLEGWRLACALGGEP